MQPAPYDSSSAVQGSAKQSLARRLRTAIKVVVVARSVRPSLGFVIGFIRGAPRVFFSHRLGHPVCLRPRADLQVARELLAKDAYAVPSEVAKALSGAESIAILDLGANIGLYSLSAIRTFGRDTRVRAVEPDPANLELLAQNVELAGCREQVEIRPCAAGARSGSAEFVGGLASGSHLTRPSEEQGGVEVAVLDAFQLAAGCQLLKIDIEGSEWELLRDPRLKQTDARAIALEWHGEWHDAASETDTPEQEATQLLEAAGFAVGYSERFRLNGFLWAWRTN